MNIRVVNLRNYVPLGNPYPMNDESMRDDVCDKYDRYFERQILASEPLFIATLNEISATSKTYNIALGCWCFPKRCHAMTIKEYIEKKEVVGMKILECSSAGDKRFSAFGARVSAFGVIRSIEEHYQSSKTIDGASPRFTGYIKGKPVNGCRINGVDLEPRFLTQWYKLLWVKYLDNNPELVAYAKTFDDFSDKFKGKAINCQADVIRQYVKQGRDSIMNECKELNDILLANKTHTPTPSSPSKIAFTGHRPDKLWGYDLNNSCYIKTKDKVKAFIRQQGSSAHVFTGMALGFDTIVALAAIELKAEGYPVFIEACIPCRDHSCKWQASSKKQYDDILSKCDKVTLVTDAPYSPSLMQVRNEYMTNNADIILALWNGTSGGTGNCVKYAKSVNKKIFIINPDSIV
jgi:uncharacterized phage-like protein YoqJ